MYLLSGSHAWKGELLLIRVTGQQVRGVLLLLYRALLPVTDSAVICFAMAECNKDDDRDIHELVLDLPGYDKTNDTVDKINGLKKSFPVYDDDIYLLTYPKSGMLNVIFINIQGICNATFVYLKLVAVDFVPPSISYQAMHLQDLAFVPVFAVYQFQLLAFLNICVFYAVSCAVLSLVSIYMLQTLANRYRCLVTVEDNSVRLMQIVNDTAQS